MSEEYNDDLLSESEPAGCDPEVCQCPQMMGYLNGLRREMCLFEEIIGAVVAIPILLFVSNTITSLLHRVRDEDE